MITNIHLYEKNNKSFRIIDCIKQSHHTSNKHRNKNTMSAHNIVNDYNKQRSWALLMIYKFNIYGIE